MKRKINFSIFHFNFSPSNGQNIVQILLQSAKKWVPSRERFDCLIHEFDGSIEVAVCKSYKIDQTDHCFGLLYLFRVVF